MLRLHRPANSLALVCVNWGYPDGRAIERVLGLCQGGRVAAMRRAVGWGEGLRVAARVWCGGRAVEKS